MLSIVVPKTKMWNDKFQKFANSPETKLDLEHSLISISKWESIWKKPFLSTEGKSTEETISYIRCMTLTRNVDDLVYSALTVGNLESVADYISDKHTATTINEVSRPNHGELITSELIYYWMVTLNIPMECQRWHLNRLITLIRVCNVKNAPPKKMTQQEVMSKHRALNAARRKRLKTKG